MASKCELLVVCSSEKAGRVLAAPWMWPRAAGRALAPAGPALGVLLAELAQGGSASSGSRNCFLLDCTVNGHLCQLLLKHLGKLKEQVRQDGWWFHQLSTPAGADAESSGVLLESCGFWATKCLICLMEMDQKMSW